MHLLRLIVLSVVLSTLTVAQWGPDAWRWGRFTQEDGLPALKIRDLVETVDGRVWALGETAAAWFDGHRWHRVTPAEAGQGIHYLDHLRSGNLIIHRGGRPYVLSPDGEARIEGLDDVSGITGVARIRAGKLIVHRPAPDEMFLLDRTLDRMTAPAPSQRAHRRSLLTTWRRVYFPGVGGLYRREAGGWRMHFPVEGSLRLRALAENRRGDGAMGIMFPASHRGLWRWDADGGPEPVPLPFESPVRTLDIGDDGTIAVVGDGGRIVLIDERGTHALALPPSEGLLIRGVLCRHDGDIWLCGESGVLVYRRSDRRWRTLPAVGSRMRVNEMLRAEDGRLWLGTDDGVMVLNADDSIAEHIPAIDGRSLGTVTALGQDQKGRIWVASGLEFSGAWCFDGNEWRHRGEETGLLAPRVHRIRRDLGGRLWFLAHDDDVNALTGRGAFLLEGDRFRRWSTSNGLLADRVYDLAEGPPGTYWFATVGGLSRWQNGQWRHWTRKNGLRHDRIFCLTVSPTGRVWFGHQTSGVGTLDEGVPRYVTSADGLVDDEVWGLELDDRGWIWVATRSGLGLIREGRALAFPRSEAVRNLQIWPILAEGARVSIGTMGRGVVRLDLDAVIREAPRVSIDAPMVRVHRSRFSWRPSAREAHLPSEHLVTRYRVDGGPWSSWTPERTASFTDLRPGPHDFEIQTRSLLGDVAGESVSFEIPLPVYQRPGFIAPVGGLVLLALLLGFLWLHTKRRQQRQIAASEARYREVFASANDAILIHSPDGDIHEVNAAAEKILGHTAAALAGMNLVELAAEEDREALRDALETVTGAADLYDLVVIDGAGHRVCLQVSTRPTAGDPDVLQSFARDVTERKDLERQVFQLQKMEALGRLAGGIAHDFNNLLLALGGYADLALDRVGENHPAREFLAGIVETGDRAAALTRQLLTFSRDGLPQREVHDVNDVIGEMVDMLRRIIGEDIELDIARTETVLPVRADESQLQQIFMNLAVNARDAMPGGGRLSIRSYRLTLHESESALGIRLDPGEYGVVRVSDTGHGMSDELRERVFEPFFTTKEPGKGTGLGLSTVYAITRRLGGGVDVDSRPGQGACFTVFLRLCSDAEAAAAATSSRPKAVGQVGAATVLLVEDEDPVRKTLSQILERHGYRVSTARDGVEAQDVAAGLPRLDVLLTDVTMPRMSGTDLARDLRRDRPDLRVLFMSGYVGQGEFDNPLPAGHDFLAKPFNAAKLIDRIQELLGDRDAARGVDA